MRSDSGNNYGQWKNAEFDRLMDQAQLEPDAVKRGDILAHAEQIALDDYALVPTQFRKTRNLVEPYVKGWISNLRDFNRSRWLSIEGKPE